MSYEYQNQDDVTYLLDENPFENFTVRKSQLIRDMEREEKLRIIAVEPFYYVIGNV